MSRHPFLERTFEGLPEPWRKPSNRNMPQPNRACCSNLILASGSSESLLWWLQ